ncbi:nuclear transport factor 2 family protein [Streptomyces sp. SMC 277]|uniref:Nuclear transport factor 2 family protein n=2 Tax=Streptomyces antimicrobicus TaxID=2883108 RepID=A0ABS8BA90_9ACTN|nr:nuclear transport factor 2 family protein [Streptomyces antimicrobicus]
MNTQPVPVAPAGPADTPLALIRRAYRAFHDRDVPALLATLDPQVEWVHPDGMSHYGLGGTKHGHDGVREFLSRVPAVLGGMRLEPQEFVADGDRVVVFGVRQVTSVRGTTRTLPFIHSWTLRDGVAVRMEDVFDTVVFQQLIES